MALSHPESDAAKAKLSFRFLRTIGRALFRALFAIRVEGLERVPQTGAYVLACNHLSFIDPAILLAFLPPEPRIHFLAAAEYTVTGPWFIRKLVAMVGGIIPVDRESHKGDRAAVVQALRTLKAGGVLGIFPEGRCGEAEGELLPLKIGAALFASRTGRPVQVLGMSGTFELYFRKRIHLRVGPLLVPKEGESQEELLERVREALAQTVPPLDPHQPKKKYLAWLSKIV